MSINNNGLSFLSNLLGLRSSTQGNKSPVVHSQMAEFSKKVVPQALPLSHHGEQQKDSGLKVVQDLLGATKPLKATKEMQTLKQKKEVEKVQVLLGVSTGHKVSI